MQLFQITVDVWNIRDGQIMELQYNDDIFIRKQKRTTNSHSVKVSYLEKWIRKNKQLTSFTFDMFYKEYPKQVDNKRLPMHISRLITDGILVQMGKNSFKINRGEKK